jgi:alpha-glucosidase
MASPDAPERDLYLFVEGKPDGQPPNNWESVFGGPAWSRSGRGEEWYLHLFAPEQPDLNWRNPEVVEEFDRILQFWFDRGIDGMRIDVAHGMLKDPELRDNPPPEDARMPPGAAALVGQLKERYSFDHEDVHDVFRRWRALVDSYPGDRALVGEVFLWEPTRVARYVRTDELHLAFNFLLLGQKWVAAAMRESIELTLAALGEFGATATWVLSNHDVVRHASRFGDGALGVRRARAGALLLLGLPGTVFVYQGEELGLEEVTLADADRQDPVFFRTGGARKGRDGARVPIPWSSAGAPGYGFTSGTPWLPTPDGWGERSVEGQVGATGSMLELYRAAIATRRATALGSSAPLAWLDTPDDVVAFRRDDIAVVVNFGDESVGLPVEGEIVLASDDGASTTQLPGNAAAWIRTA